MTDEDGSVKITDFGIARIATGAQSCNETKTVAGTPNYMSPEQVQGLPVDGRSDQFSLAVIAYEILTGERPFHGRASEHDRLQDRGRRAAARAPAERHADAAHRRSAAQRRWRRSRRSVFRTVRILWARWNWPARSRAAGRHLAAGAAAEQPTIAVEHPLRQRCEPAEWPAARRCRWRSAVPHGTRELLPVSGERSWLLAGRRRESSCYKADTGRSEPVSTSRADRTPETGPSQPQNRMTAGGSRIRRRIIRQPKDAPDSATPAVAVTGTGGRRWRAIRRLLAARSRCTLRFSVRPDRRPRRDFSVPAAPPAAYHLQDIWVPPIPPGARVILDENPGLLLPGPVPAARRRGCPPHRSLPARISE